jgi:hypothetical protein
MTLLLIIAVILLVFWLLGITIRFTDSGLIHIVLVVAVVLFIVWFLRAGLRVF